ncbi:MAG: single-stranded DNA-binding protein [Treponema sp.]|nr:single-stranded DNA-binding protein [Treponema sp.]
MSNLNSVLIEGNLVKDPQVKTTTKGASVCNFSIASNRYYKQNSVLEEEVGYFDIEAWGKLGDICANQGRKGRGVRVVGRLKQDRWTTEDGKNRNKVFIVAEHVEYRTDYRRGDEFDSDTSSSDRTYGTAQDLHHNQSRLASKELEDIKEVAF